MTTVIPVSTNPSNYYIYISLQNGSTSSYKPFAHDVELVSGMFHAEKTLEEPSKLDIEQKL